VISAFDTLLVNLPTPGGNWGSLVLEYWNGSAWAALTVSSDETFVSGDTLKQSGRIFHNIPGGWTAGGELRDTTLLDSSFFWARLTTSLNTDSSSKTFDRLAPALKTQVALLGSDSLVMVSPEVLKPSLSTSFVA